MLRFVLHQVLRAALVLAIFPSGLSGAMIPNLPDEHTLHLWHLDESGPPFHDNGKSPKSLQGLLNGASAGQGSLNGMGSSVSFHHSTGGTPLTVSYQGGVLLAQPKSSDGDADNVTSPFPIMGHDGAFTFEAIVKLNCLPADAPGMALDIISMDGESGSRVFNFRIEKPGFVNFIPFAGFHVRGGGLATIPVTGPHAINTSDWFHVAVTYDGREGLPGNLLLYWTRISPGLQRANLIGRGSLVADLGKLLSDFAIGNTGRTLTGNHECNPFPGLIDEVRISSIARQPEDFFFIPAEARKAAYRDSNESAARDAGFRLGIQQVFVNGKPRELPSENGALKIEPGIHRLDLDFALAAGNITNPLEVRCCMEGIEDSWRPSERGMWLVCEVLGPKGESLSRTAFASFGQSPGWSADSYESALTPRLEPLFLPGTARSLRITLSSGTPDTTGQSVVSSIAVHLPGSTEPAESIWKNGSLEDGVRMDTVGGVPTGWQRGSEDPALAPMVLRPEGKALGLVDGSHTAAGYWTCEQKLPPISKAGVASLLSWKEAHNVIGGGTHRATYLNVPPGNYRFRAVAVTRRPFPDGAHLELPITVRQSFWENSWFRPVAASVAVGLVALVILQTYRRRALARLSRMQILNSLERDRTRIARDLHDDLGTRVSSLMMGVSLVQRDIECPTPATRQHLSKINTTARDLVTAMDELVWAVDPANDTLDQLVSHLTGMAQELFRGTEMTLRISVPMNPPAMSMRSEFRHHFSLAVKETLHNVLKHAGPCEVSLEIQIEGGELSAIVRDKGVGFDPSLPCEGNGLINMQSRLAEIGGTCTVVSQPGQGTCVSFHGPIQSNSSAASTK